MGFWDKVLETSETLDDHTYYELLGVPQDASLPDIEERFHALARRLHPDRHAREPSRERQAALTRLYARINEAARVLGAPETRRLYDENLAQGQRRLDPEAKPKAGPRDTRDPKSASARSLYEQSQAMFAAKNLRGARAKLALARQLEPDSAAIARALAEVDAAEGKKPSAKSAKPAGPAKPAEAPPEPSKPAAAAPPARRRPSSPASRAKPAPAPAPAAAGKPAAARPAAAPADKPVGEGPAPWSKQREHRRFPVRKTVSITANNWGAVERLATEDLGRGGTFLATARPFPVGTPVALRIAAPDDSLFELQASVVWVSDGSKRPHGMGLQFENVGGDVRARLEQLLVAAKAASLPDLEELVETVARIARLGPSVFELGADYSAQQLDDAFMPMAMRYDPSRFAAEAPERRIAEDLAEQLRAAYQAASRNATS